VDYQVKMGKNIAVFLIIITNFYYEIGFVIGLNIKDVQLLQKQILEIATIAMISLLFYKGFKIAEWLIFGLLIKLVLTIVFYPLQIAGVLELYNGYLMLVIIAIIAILGGTFIIRNENCINDFMNYQRSKRKWLNK
jgi:hypothetical protein